jgi:glycerophosphoryl diester phosphodiesterase
MSDIAWLTARPIAHRGLHDRANGVIENSMAAFAAAAERGLAMECDVQLTSDGEAVVFHDYGLERLTGLSGAVLAMTATALGASALTGSAARDTIRPLKELVDLIAGRAPIVVETFA